MDKTYEEITRQYLGLQKTIARMEESRPVLTAFRREHGPGRLVFLGSGSSYDVAQSAERICGMRFGLDACSLPAGDLLVNFSAYEKLLRGAQAVAISRSGSTTEIIRCAALLREKFGVPTLGITCVDESPLAQEAELCLKLPWAFDESVCQTGTVSNLYAACALLPDAMLGSGEIFAELRAAAENGGRYLGAIEPALKETAAQDWEKAVVLADGSACGIAAEAALAFQEICGVPSNYYHVLDVRHGPAVLLDPKTLVLLSLTPENRGYQRSLTADIVKKGCRVLVSADAAYGELPGTLTFPSTGFEGAARGLALVNLAQFAAYHRALYNRRDPGNPAGLDAWISLR